VCHYPAGTSKWNKVEQRLWSSTSVASTGRGIVETATIVDLVAATTAEAGMTVQVCHDAALHEPGGNVTDVQTSAISVAPHDWRGDWNYTICPPDPAT